MSESSSIQYLKPNNTWSDLNPSTKSWDKAAPWLLAAAAVVVIAAMAITIYYCVTSSYTHTYIVHREIDGHCVCIEQSREVSLAGLSVIPAAFGSLALLTLAAIEWARRTRGARTCLTDKERANHVKLLSTLPLRHLYYHYRVKAQFMGSLMPLVHGDKAVLSSEDAKYLNRKFDKFEKADEAKRDELDTKWRLQVATLEIMHLNNIDTAERRYQLEEQYATYRSLSNHIQQLSRLPHGTDIIPEEQQTIFLAAKLT